MIELISCGAFSCPKGNDRENQDALLLPQQCDDGFIFAVADGVGSYAGAKEAAQTAVNHVAIHKSVAAFEPNEILRGIKEKYLIYPCTSLSAAKQLQHYRIVWLREEHSM